MSRVFSHRLRVRYGECDPQGVVFNANYLAFFDVIITEFWREAIGEYNAMIEAGADMVVAESRIRFLGPAAFDEELDFELRVARLGNTALGTQIDARVGDRPVVSGEMRHVFIDPATKVKRSMPGNIRVALTPYLVVDGDGELASGPAPASTNRSGPGSVDESPSASAGTPASAPRSATPRR